MRLVIDSAAALRAAQAPVAARQLAGHDLLAPPLWRSEVVSAVHEALWRRDISADQATAIRTGLDGLGVTIRRPAHLYDAAWELAEELGWAKTYDAEFLALARIERCRVLTTDARLRRGADRTGLVLDPTEL